MLLATLGNSNDVIINVSRNLILRNPYTEFAVDKVIDLFLHRADTLIDVLPAKYSYRYCRYVAIDASRTILYFPDFKFLPRVFVRLIYRYSDPIENNLRLR